MATEDIPFAPDLDGSLFLYSGEAVCGVVPRFTVSLTMHVDGRILEDAVNDVIVLFPHMKVRLVKDSSGFMYVRNDSRVPVFLFTGKELNFSDPVLNGYLFCVSYSGKTVFLDVHSALLDEKGLASLAKAIVFRYIQLSGYPVENDGSVRALPEGQQHVSMEDPFEKIEDIPAARPVWYMDAKAFHDAGVPVKGSEYGHSSHDEAFDAVQIRIPLQKLRSFVKEYSGQPEILVSSVVSQALYEQYSGDMEKGEYIVASISVNLRRYFPTVSLKPFSTSVSLACNRRLGEYPFNTILMSQKKLLEAQLKTDALAYNAQQRIADIEKVQSCTGFASKCTAASGIISGKAAQSTYMLRNAGNIGMPESMMRYVTEFYPMYTPSVHPLSFSSIIFRNEVILTVTLRHGYLPDISRRIVSLMNDNDIYAYISDEFSFIPVRYVL